jgi:hypothetical protein
MNAVAEPKPRKPPTRRRPTTKEARDRLDAVAARWKLRALIAAPVLFVAGLCVGLMF